MKKAVLLLLIFQKSFSQDVFHSECWKETLSDLNNPKAIIAVSNRYDNFANIDGKRTPVIIYYKDSLNNWRGKLVLISRKRKTNIWQEVDFELNTFFEHFLNDSIKRIKSTFVEMYEDPQRTWGHTHVELFYKDSISQIVNEWYSIFAGVTILYKSHPLVYYLYTYGIANNFNVKFRNKRRYK